MSRIKSLSRRAWLLIACAVSVIAAPIISWALQRDPEMQKRYEQIAKMTESERTRLEYQYEEFRSLSEAEREQYRQLHAQLTGERNDLQPTLDAYTAFLRTLNPVDRADAPRQPDHYRRHRQGDDERSPDDGDVADHRWRPPEVAPPPVTSGTARTWSRGPPPRRGRPRSRRRRRDPTARGG